MYLFNDVFSIVNKTYRTNYQENVLVPAEKVKQQKNIHKKNLQILEIPKKSHIHDRGVPK